MWEDCPGSGGHPAGKPTPHYVRAGQYFTATCPACGRTVEPKPPAFTVPSHLRRIESVARGAAHP